MLCTVSCVQQCKGFSYDNLKFGDLAKRIVFQQPGAFCASLVLVSPSVWCNELLKIEHALEQCWQDAFLSTQCGCWFIPVGPLVARLAKRDTRFSPRWEACMARQGSGCPHPGQRPCEAGRDFGEKVRSGTGGKTVPLPRNFS